MRFSETITYLWDRYSVEGIYFPDEEFPSVEIISCTNLDGDDNADMDEIKYRIIEKLEKK